MTAPGMKVTPMKMGADPQPPCPACGTTGYELGGPWFRCPMCGMGYLKEAEFEKRVEELAKIAYVETPGARAPEAPGERNHKISVFQKVVTGYNAFKGKGDVVEAGIPGKCFEIGFGNGYMMEGATMCRWTVDGCEASQVAVTSAQQRMLNAWVWAFDKVPPALRGIKEAYDLAWGWDSFEHMVDLKAAFRNAADILRPGGILVIHSPDFDRFYHDPNHPHFERSHLWHMTPGAIEGLCGPALKVLKTERGSCWGDRGRAHPDNFVAWMVKP